MEITLQIRSRLLFLFIVCALTLQVLVCIGTNDEKIESIILLLEFLKTEDGFKQFVAVLGICCKFEVKFLCIIGKIGLPIWNFLYNNFLRFVILHNLCYTVQFLSLIVNQYGITFFMSTHSEAVLNFKSFVQLDNCNF